MLVRRRCRRCSETPELTRSSLALATGGIISLRRELPEFRRTDRSAGCAQRSPLDAGLPAGLQRIAGTLSRRAGSRLKTWNSAFGSEFGVIGDWPANVAVAGAARDVAGERRGEGEPDCDGVDARRRAEESPWVPPKRTVSATTRSRRQIRWCRSRRRSASTEQVAVLGLDRRIGRGGDAKRSSGARPLW